ncbi:hypothetical protein ACIBG7_24695 [Nonomuraea sp. NPDC050328]|uniref:hypothetical protein n=1 Tax=Nonomuraea sp. NPDC050328 TaxID=3364361 RepID=UPI0037B49BE9
MARVYQAVLRDGAARLGPRLRTAFTTWLDVPDTGGGDLDLATAAGAHVRLHDTPHCGRYVADTRSGLKIVVTWAHTPHDRRNWATVVLDDPGGGSPADLVSGPEFLPGFLATARATDGLVPLDPGAHEIDVTNLDELLGWLTDPARRVPVIVLSPDSRADVPAGAARLARAAAGLALVAHLHDQAAQDRFNAALGESLEVFGGGLRTYLPGLRPGHEPYPHRHPIRSGGALRDHGVRAYDVVISGVIRESVRHALPEDIRAATRLIPGILAGKTSADGLFAGPSTQPTLRDRLAALSVDPRVLARGTSDPPAVRVTSDSPAVRAASDPPAVRAPEPEKPAPAVAPPPAPAGDGLHPAPTTPVGEPPTRGRTAEPEALAAMIAERVAGQLSAEIMAALEMVSGDTSSETLRSIRIMTAHVEALRRELDQAKLHQHHSASLQAEAEGQSAVLEHELTRLRTDHDQLELDYEQLAADERRARERVRWLEGRLAALSQPVYGVATPDELWEPESLMDVLLRARGYFAHVTLAAHLDRDAAALDVTYPRHCRIWAGKAWDALRALDAYAADRAADRFQGGFYQWCDHPPPGRPALVKHLVTMRESESVSGNSAFRAERTFPGPDGPVFMEAHIKLQRVGYPAPRLYFHDDAGGPSARVWVGYLGNHLSNTRTN